MFSSFNEAKKKNEHNLKENLTEVKIYILFKRKQMQSIAEIELFKCKLNFDSLACLTAQ